MPNKKISQFPLLNTLTGSVVFSIVSSGENYTTTFDTVSDSILDNMVIPAVDVLGVGLSGFTTGSRGVINSGNTVLSAFETLQVSKQDLLNVQLTAAPETLSFVEIDDATANINIVAVSSGQSEINISTESSGVTDSIILNDDGLVIQSDVNGNTAIIILSEGFGISYTGTGIYNNVDGFYIKNPDKIYFPESVISGDTLARLSDIASSQTITGGTYDSNTGVATFTNSSGLTFQVTGFFTSSDDDYVSGFTFNQGNYDLTLYRTDGVTLTENLGVLSSDMSITGGTYDSNTGVATFINNSGGTFQVVGFLTGYTDTNIYNTNGTLTGNRTVDLDGKTLDFTEDIKVTSVTIGRGGGAVTTNTAIGIGSLTGNTNGYKNTGVGYNSLFNNISGYSNTAIGYLASYNNIGGTENISLGAESLYANTTGRANTAIGFQSLYNNESNFNVAVGAQALQYNTIGINNVGIGVQAAVYNITGSSNVGIGYQSLYNNYHGNSNVAIGYKAGFNMTSGSGNTYLGCNAGFENISGSNKLYIGNNEASTLMYGEFDNGFVSINTTSPTNALHVSAATNPLRLEGLQSGTTDTLVLTTDSNGEIHYKNYKNYSGFTALLTQSGTNPPDCIVLENDLGNYQCNYNSAGYYLLIFDANLTGMKVHVLIGGGNSVRNTNYIVSSAFDSNANKIIIKTYINGSEADDVLSDGSNDIKTSLEIKVYY